MFFIPRLDVSLFSAVFQGLFVLPLSSIGKNENFVLKLIYVFTFPPVVILSQAFARATTTAPTETDGPAAGDTKTVEPPSSRRLEPLVAGELEAMWVLAAQRFAVTPYSNGNDSRYTAVKNELRKKYGKTAIVGRNKARLKRLAIHKGVETEEVRAVVNGRQFRLVARSS